MLSQGRSVTIQLLVPHTGDSLAFLESVLFYNLFQKAHFSDVLIGHVMTIDYFVSVLRKMKILTIVRLTAVETKTYQCLEKVMMMKKTTPLASPPGQLSLLLVASSGRIVREMGLSSRVRKDMTAAAAAARES